MTKKIFGCILTSINKKIKPMSKSSKLLRICQRAAGGWKGSHGSADEWTCEGSPKSYKVMAVGADGNLIRYQAGMYVST